MSGTIYERCPACDARLAIEASQADGSTVRCDACSCLLELAPAPADREVASLMAA
jgi:predicted Zn finger-like uncharacterized protein